jgi:hypothetical protein
MATWAELVVPPRGLSRAELLWLAFVTVQALDGVFSYVGVATLGPGIEANPLLGWYLEVFGPGAVLYMTHHHRVVAGLTLMYVVFAVGPWIHVLSSHPA